MKPHKLEVISIGNMKATVYAGGRFNPPNIGHSELFRLVQSTANKFNADHVIGVVAANDPKKNPLSPDRKMYHLRNLFPEMNFKLQHNSDMAFWIQLSELYKSGTEHLIMIAGSDRVGFFKNNLRKLNGNRKAKLFNFKLISFIENFRDTSDDGMEKMSASSLRKHAISNNFEMFIKLLPENITKEHALELFNDVREGMLSLNSYTAKV